MSEVEKLDACCQDLHWSSIRWCSSGVAPLAFTSTQSYEQNTRSTVWRQCEIGKCASSACSFLFSAMQCTDGWSAGIAISDHQGPGLIREHENVRSVGCCYRKLDSCLKVIENGTPSIFPLAGVAKCQEHCFGWLEETRPAGLFTPGIHACL